MIPISGRDPSETRRLADFARQTFIATYAHLNNPADFADYVEKAFSEEQIRRELARPGSLFYWIIDAEDQPLAYLKLNLPGAQTENSYAEGLEIERIYVQPSRKGQGLGRRLIGQAVQVAREHGLPYVWLGVWERNPEAIEFYTNMGFERCGEHIFTIGQDAQRDWIMRKDLA